MTARHLLALTAAAMLGVGGVAGCGSGSSGGGATVSSAPSTRQLDERTNGATVDVHLGDTVVVVLHSTYWTFAPPVGFLQPLGPPQPSSSPCSIAGSGCGTVTASYNATHVGTATLRAHRDSCGEALRCTGSEADWTVTVRIS